MIYMIMINHKAQAQRSYSDLIPTGSCVLL